MKPKIFAARHKVDSLRGIVESHMDHQAKPRDVTAKIGATHHSNGVPTTVASASALSAAIATPLRARTGNDSPISFLKDFTVAAPFDITGSLGAHTSPKIHRSVPKWRRFSTFFRLVSGEIVSCCGAGGRFGFGV